MLDIMLRVAALTGSALYEAVFGGWLDVILVTCFTTWKQRDDFAILADEYLDEDIFSLAWKILVASVVAIAWFRFRLRLVLDIPAENKPWTGLGKPVLIPAKTTHRRLFPEKHAFSYSYLTVGVPVGWEGSAGDMVSTNNKDSSDEKSWFPSKPIPSKAWFHVDGADHLQRGPGSLKTKLHGYLKSQGINPSTYPHAYLVTAASFMGYNFNPVSFWYLYSESKEFSAMILEVNNTFGERRMYLLTADGQSNDEDARDKFTYAWPKDFHVSPFNSRKGSYSLQARDILPLTPEGGRLDGNITLKSSKGHAKITARLFGEESPIDPTTMGFFDKAKFLLQWWWVGFATFSRIVKEAGVLFFRKNLHVWYRPEPLDTTISRSADATERALEPVFRAYLRHLVERSGEDLTITYLPAGSDEEEVIMRTPMASKAAAALVEGSQKDGKQDAEDDDATSGKEENRDGNIDPEQEEYAKPDPNSPNHLTFHVLTPAFYTRFIHYAHDFEAIFSELRGSRTVHVSRPELLPRVFVSKTPPPSKPLALDSPHDFACFSVIKALRRPPEKIERPMTSAQASSTTGSGGGDGSRDTLTHTVQDVRGFRISGMDGFVLSGSGGQEMKRRYRSLVSTLFFAEWFTFGSVDMLWGAILVLRVAVAWGLATGMVELAAQLVDDGN